MSLQRLVHAIRRRLNPPKEIDRIVLGTVPFKSVEARIEYGVRESGSAFETFHFETWPEGFTPGQLPELVSLCVKLAERYYRYESLSEYDRAGLWLLLRAYGLEPTMEEETELGWHQ